jgi:predicted ArsR family transcriptional regulator
MGREPLHDLRALSALEDPVRRRVYEVVAERSEPTSREQAAKATGISRSLAAYHLDKLADEGLVAAAYERRTGRSGPGAGRPAKVYALAPKELSVSVPARDYGVAARLLADAAANDPGQTGKALRDAAGRLGREIGEEAVAESEDVVDTLRRRGYEPHEDDGVIRLRNCPFHAVAQRHPEIVCDMNLALLGGVAAAVDADLRVTLEPAAGRCCVVLEASSPAPRKARAGPKRPEQDSNLRPTP